jgi:hypothetical protein
MTISASFRNATVLWGGIFILGFADILRKFPSDPRSFSPESEEICATPPCGFLIGIYLFYESWSTETFGKSRSKKRGGSV